jgi:hyaluronoglucosaminidase
MTRSRRGVAGAVCAAVLLAGPAAARIDPPPAGGGALPVPAIFPVPQSETALAGTVAVTPTISLVVGPTADASTVDLVRGTLASAGAKRFTGAQPSGALVVSVGSRASDLPAQGYVLKIARGRIDLAGADTAGTFYAAQTLRQIVQGPRLPALVIRDWPSLPIRGVVEGFYGPIWTTESLVDMLDFLGAHKLNAFVYAPKNDPYIRDRWQEPYWPARLSELSGLVDRAAADHVTFTYSISPGVSICYSSEADFQTLLAKLQSVWDAGVRSFAIGLDDISYDWHCAEDAARFGTGPAEAGAAQAYLVNRVAREFVDTHPGTSRLIAVPKEYDYPYQSPYKTAFVGAVDPDVILQWTGGETYSPQITLAGAAIARQVYQHDLLVWDNYPVAPRWYPRTLRLAPYGGRAPGLSRLLLGIVANPMVVPQLSKIPLFTFADYAWNDSRYDPASSWSASLTEAAAGDGVAAAALRAFSDVNYASPIDERQAPELSVQIDAFWHAWQTGTVSSVTSEGAALAAAFRVLRDAPAVLRARLSNQELVAEAAPWLDAAATWARAGLAALDVLLVARTGRGTQADGEEQSVADLVAQAKAATFVEYGTAEPLSVGAGALDKFVADALAAL